MQTITLTITISVPEGAVVEVAPQVEETPVEKPTPAPMIMFSQDPEYPEWMRAPGSRWTDEEIDIASDLSLTDADVAELLGRSTASVAAYRLNHGLRQKMHNRVVDKSATRAMARWTKSEIEYLQKRYNGSNGDEIAEYLGRSAGAIQSKARGLAK